MTDQPRCPRCHQLEHVDPLTSNAKGRWWCAECNLVFTGSAAEWQAEQDRQVRAAEGHSTPRIRGAEEAIAVARQHFAPTPAGQENR